MKKKNIITTLLFMAAFVTTNAQLMFSISGNGLEKPSYILGTIHLLSGDLLDSIPTFLEAEKQCQQLFVESDVTDKKYVHEARAAGQQIMTLPDGKTISDILGEERMAILQEKMKEKIHVNLVDFASHKMLHYQPFVFTFMFNWMIQVEVYMKYPAMRNGNMMDAACIKRAQARGWKVGNLDQKLTSEELEKSKEALTPIDEQVDSLMAMLSNYDERKQKILKKLEGMKDMSNLWSAGDYDSFERLVLPDCEESPAIFAQRNKKWIPIIIEAIKEMPTLIVFGAGHLAGPEGVVRMLRDAGYKVEQVKK